ncbi:MAG: homocitrate synthase [Lachnospiraceae bacterium]|nr:homocitrate synthase [Lachnospiraceae bacterium]
MKEKRWIVDTTLRDGEQSPGIAFAQEDKIELAIMLDKLGVHEIEAGIPEMKVESINYIEEIKKECHSAKISLWTRMNVEDVKFAVSFKPDILHIGVPVSYVQIYSKLKKNKLWVQKTLEECMKITSKAEVEVTVGFEDASRSDEGFLMSMVKLTKNYGGTRIRLADTVGILTPQRAGSLVKKLVQEAETELEFHAHNDLGMAVANSIESAKCGANYIDCTLLGIGERSGNCDLYKFLNSCDRTFDFGIDKNNVKKIEKVLLTKICRGELDDRYTF